MRILFFIFTFAFSLQPYASNVQDQSCRHKSVDLIGQFGKYSSPLVELWSETAGNFTFLQVKSPTPLTKAVFEFRDQKGNMLLNKSLIVDKNQSETFDLLKMIKESVIRPNNLTIKLFQKNGNFHCKQEMTIIEKDGQDGVLIKL